MQLSKIVSSYIQEKVSHPGIQKHSKNISWMFLAKIGSMVITFIATAYIARNLGPTNYGQLSYAISFVSLFSFFASLGVDAILHREIIRQPNKKNELLGSSIIIRMIASIVTICITALIALGLSSKDVSLLLIFIISLSPLFGSFQLLSYEFQAETKSKYPSILTLCIVFLLNILKITTISLDGGVIYLALIVLLEPVLYSFGYMYLKSFFYNDLTKLTYNKVVALQILKESTPLIFASAFYLIYARIDQVMIKHMLGAHAVGLYDSAVRISELSYFIPQLVLLSLFPTIINTKSFTPEIYYMRLKKLLFFLIALSFSISLVTTLFSKQLLLIIFGTSFIAALPALYICAWSTLGASLNSFAQQILLAENLTKNISTGAFFGMIVNVSLNLYLIPLYGISGAALATLISYIVPFLSLFLFAKTRSILINVLKA